MSEAKPIDYQNVNKESDFLILEVFNNVVKENWPEEIRAQFVYNDSADNDDPWYTYYVLGPKGGVFCMGLRFDPDTRHTLQKIKSRTYKVASGDNHITLEFSRKAKTATYTLVTNGEAERHKLTQKPAPYRS